MKLSVVMPVFNEQATLRRVVERVMSVGLELELLCVDDGSIKRIPGSPPSNGPPISL